MELKVMAGLHLKLCNNKFSFYNNQLLVEVQLF